MLKIIKHKIKGYKTLLSNLLMAGLPVFVAIDPYALNLSPSELALYTVAVAIANIYLRSITTTPMGKKW